MAGSGLDQEYSSITKAKKAKTYDKRLLFQLLPASLFIVLFFVGGMLQTLWLSMELVPNVYGNGPPGAAYYELANSSFLQSLLRTVGLAAASSLLAGVTGMGVALLLAVRARRFKWLSTLLHFPMGIPHLLAAYLLTQLFWQSGWYSRLLYTIGIIDEMDQFPVLIQDPWGIGILLTYSWKEIPFMVMLLLPFVVRALDEWGQAARCLGASFAQTVRWVVLPMLFPIWVGGMWIIFAFVLGAYEIPALTGSTASSLVPVLAWQEYTAFGLDRRTVAMAMNFVLAAVALVAGILLLYLERVWYQRGRRW
jgi:putative spermidine/putrescine transport system permease protein